MAGKSKDPVAFNSVNIIATGGFAGLSKASRQAKKLAKRKARINALAGITPDSDHKEALTTKGRIRAIGGRTKILQDKSTAYWAKTDMSLVTNLNGSLIELGNRATYPKGERVRLETTEKFYNFKRIENAKAGNALPHKSLYGNRHHLIRRPVNLKINIWLKEK